MPLGRALGDLWARETLDGASVESRATQSRCALVLNYVTLALLETLSVWVLSSEWNLAFCLWHCCSILLHTRCPVAACGVMIRVTAGKSTKGAVPFDLQQSEIRGKWKASEVKDRALNSVRLCEQTLWLETLEFTAWEEFKCLCSTQVADAGSSCLLLQGQIRELEETALKSEVICFILLYAAESSWIIVLETQVINLDHFEKAINILEFLAK